jgi:hypothetical protein
MTRDSYLDLVKSGKFGDFSQSLNASVVVVEVSGNNGLLRSPKASTPVCYRSTRLFMIICLDFLGFYGVMRLRDD